MFLHTNPMKRVAAFSLCLLLVLPLFCFRTEASYTVTAADVAMDSFQEYCYNPSTKLYYNNTDQNGIAAIWTHAVFWNIVLDAYERTGDVKYLNLSNDIYQGGRTQYAAYDWDNHTVWFVFDDLMWWILSMLRAYQLTGNQNCLNTATAGFQNVYQRAYDAENGGMFWGFGADGYGKGHKNSCINYPTIIAAMELYEITANQYYLNIAQTLYAWARQHLFNPATGSVPDLLSEDGETDWTNYTYNQGTMIGAACKLYLATGNSTYLNDANLAAQYTKNVMCDSNGILPAEGDWNEQGCMKAIFAHNIGILIKDCNQTQWAQWIYHNIDEAWAHRDPERNLMYRNYTVSCSQGMIQSYEACSGVAFMQVFSPNESENKQSIATPSVTVYQDMEYGGNSVALRPGRYNLEALTAAGVPENWMTSVRVPANMVFQAFSEDNFGGEMWEYTADCSNVGAEANDQMSSCIIYYRNGVTFYADDLFRGNCVTLTKGRYTMAELNQLGIPNDWMTSLAIPEGWNVIVYSEDHFAGDAWNFGRGTHNVGTDCNDKMTSVKIF